MACPVHLLVVPGLLMATDPIGTVIINVEAAAEPEKRISPLRHPVEIHPRSGIPQHTAVFEIAQEVIPSTLVHPVVMGGDFGEIGISTADPQETLRILLDNRSGFVHRDDIVRHCCDRGGSTPFRTHTGKSIDPDHEKRPILTGMYVL